MALAAAGLAGANLLLSCSPTPEPGPAEDAIKVTINTDPNDPVYARAQSPNGTEFVVYADKDDDGKVISVNQLDTKTTDGPLVKTAFDDKGQPGHAESEDGSKATIAYDDTLVKIEVTDPDGNPSTDQFNTGSSTAKLGAAILQAAQAGDDRLLCGILDASSQLLLDIFDCAGRTNVTICSGSIPAAALESENFCKYLQQEVAASEFGGTVRAALLPFGVGIVAFPEITEQEELSVELAAAGFGGKEPYSFSWSIASGPVSPTIANAGSQFASVLFTVPGTYVIRMTVTGADGEIATDSREVVLPEAPG